MFLKKLNKVFPVLMLLVVSLVAGNAGGAEAYEIISNESFAAVVSGPQNVIVVDEAQEAAFQSYLAASRSKAKASPYARQIDFLKKARLIRPDQEVALDQIVVHTSRSATPVTRAGGGKLTFTVDSATWTSTDKALLEKFISIAYPSIVKVYGLPAHTATIKIVRDNTLIDRDWFTGGIYEVTKNNIRLPRYNSTKSLQRSLLHLMIHAFHGPAMFYFDGWEEGFARAASVIVGEDIDAKLAAAGLQRLGFLESGGDAFYYLMPIYDLLNQPALGNSIFLTTWTESITDATARFGGMLIPRLGMSSTAWLKVYIEALRGHGVQFFALFNDDYYARWTADKNVAGNTKTLRQIAAAVTPEVEGLPFDDWYKRQYVLDTSITIGKKLYAYVMPVVADIANSDHSTTYVFLMHYITTSKGNEKPISGYCYPVYWNHLYDLDIWLGAQYEEIFVSDGEGYLAPTFTIGNSGGSQRVAMDFTLNDQTTRVFIPMGLAGYSAAESTVFGVVAGATSGTFTYQVDADPVQSLLVTQGGFSKVDANAAAGWSIVRTSFSGGTRTAARQVNKGPGRYTFIIDALDSVQTLPVSFLKGWHKMSVPGTPLEVNNAKALGVSANSLLLARWQSDIVDPYKYQMYPRIQPFRPGWGYWLKATSTFNSTVALKMEDQSAPWRIGLMPGWNQVGCPFTLSVPISYLQVETGNYDPMTYNEARASGIVGPIFGYDRSAGAYIFPTNLEPWKGYWIVCYEPGGAVLTVPGPAAR